MFLEEKGRRDATLREETKMMYNIRITADESVCEHFKITAEVFNELIRLYTSLLNDKIINTLIFEDMGK